MTDIREMVSPIDVAEAFFAAIERGDTETVAALYDDSVSIWHNHTRQFSDKTDNVKTLSGFIARSSSRRYEERILQELPGGFVQQHLLIATAKDGFVLELPACLVCTVDNGRITTLREYFDPTPLATWFSHTSG